MKKHRVISEGKISGKSELLTSIGLVELTLCPELKDIAKSLKEEDKDARLGLNGNLLVLITREPLTNGEDDWGIYTYWPITKRTNQARLVGKVKEALKRAGITE